MNPDRSLSEIAATQGGAIRRGQALSSGLTKGQIDRRVRDGRWTVLGHFGYWIIDMPGALNLVRAAVATLPDAVVSHDSARHVPASPPLTTKFRTTPSSMLTAMERRS